MNEMLLGGVVVATGGLIAGALFTRLRRRSDVDPSYARALQALGRTQPKK